jgi:uncharacterized membrane protein
VGTRYFAGALIPPPEIVTAAVAVAEAEAAFSIGSRLAALDGGIANALLSGLLGAELSLSVMDYEALLDADVSLTGLLGALAADLDLTAATYDEVLDADVTVAQIATAMAAMDDLPAAAKAAANRLAVDTGGMNSPTLRLASLVGLGALGGQAIDADVEHLAAEVGVMELLAVSAIVAGGDHQVELDLGGSVPGLLGISLDLAIGEPPQHGGWFALGPTGTIVRTAQTRLSLVAQIGGPGGLLGARIRTPLYLELAFAEARLAEVTCPTGRPESVKVTVEARPGVADLYLAEVDPDDIADFGSTTPTSPARLVQAPLVTVTGHAHAEIADTEFERIEFDADDIAAAEIKQVSTGDFAASLTASLFSDLSLDMKVAGLGLGLPSNVTGLLGTTISAAAPAIDAVLEELLAMLGLSLGQADIRVHSANCGRAVLVQ